MIRDDFICIQLESKVRLEEVQTQHSLSHSKEIAEANWEETTTELHVLITTALYCFSWGTAVTGAALTDI